MKIDGWHIDGYGVHHDRGVTDLPDGLTVIAGANEAGKTTLQDFLVGMLFGFTASNRPDHHAPLRGGTYGGRLLITDDEGTPFTIHRGSRKSSLRITGPEGPVADPEAELQRLRGGATKDLYLALFAVHTDELDELRALTDDQVRERVFSAGILGAGRTAQAALSQLTAERDGLWKPGARSADKYLLRRLRDDLTTARGTLAEARRQATGLAGLLHRIGTVEADRDRAYAARRELQDRRSLLFVVSNQWPTWAEAAEARGELDQLGVIDPLPADAGVTLDQLLGRRDDLSTEADAAAEALAEARASLAAIDPPGPALAHAPAIADLAASLGVEQERATTIGRLADAVADAEQALAATLASIDPTADEAWLDDHPLRPAAASELRTLAAAVQATEQRAAAADDAARRALAAHQDDLAELAAREAALAERPDHPVERARRAVEDASTLVTILTQRDTVAHRLAVAQQPAPAPPAPALPSYLAPALLGAAVLAMAVGLGAGVTANAAIGAVIAVLGVVLAGLAAAARRAAHPDAATAAAPVADAASSLTHQLSELDAALEPLLATFGLTDRPTLAEATNLRLRADQLAHEASQLHQERAAVADRRIALEARGARLAQQHAAEADDARTALHDARAQWEHWLTAHRLPTSLDAASAADLIEAIGRARHLQATLHAQRSALADARRAQADHTARVQALARSTGLADDADAGRRPLAVIAELDEARRQAEAAEQAQRTQAVAVEAAKAHHRRADERAQAAAEALHQHLARLGADDVEAARARIERAERADRLRRTITQAERDLTTSIGPDPERLDAARDLLTRADPVRWRQDLDDYDQHLRAIDGRIEDLTAEHAHLTAERQHLERSADVAAAELRVADLEAQLTEAIERFATLTTAHRLVEATLARYQRERQPDVVKRASAHFTAVTDGRYQRLEVRDRDIVAIDRAEREVRADQLSKGATQQLYLCMRFALAESYARTTSLPLLLDDIAVHADDGRLPRLASVVATVAAQHQVLVFTSHAHTVAQLQAASPHARLIELDGPAGSARRMGLAAG